MGYGYRNTTGEFNSPEIAELFSEFGGLSSVVSRRSRRKKSKKSRSMSSRRPRRRKAHRTRKRSLHSRRSGKIKYTKKGQPYRIMSNGRARFIKK